MAELKTKKTAVSVKEFVAAVEHDTRRGDAESLLKLFQEVTGWKPRMWGPTIVGFGKVAYKYESGRTGEMCVVGFSPRKANLVFYYGGCDLQSKAASNLFGKLGKHKLGDGGCLYVNKLADIDQGVLREIIELGLDTQKAVAKDKNWAITPERVPTRAPRQFVGWAGVMNPAGTGAMKTMMRIAANPSQMGNLLRQ